MPSIGKHFPADVGAEHVHPNPRVDAGLMMAQSWSDAMTGTNTLAMKGEDARTDYKRRRIHTWRMKAEELRTIADEMNDTRSVRLMLNAAANYDRLADEAEQGDNSKAGTSYPERMRAS